MCGGRAARRAERGGGLGFCILMVMVVGDGVCVRPDPEEDERGDPLECGGVFVGVFMLMVDG